MTSSGISPTIPSVDKLEAHVLQLRRQVFELENAVADLAAQNASTRKDLITLSQAFEALLLECVAGTPTKETVVMPPEPPVAPPPADALLAYDDGIAHHNLSLPVAPSDDDPAPAKAKRTQPAYEASSFFNTQWSLQNDLRTLRNNTNWHSIGVTAAIMVGTVFLAFLYRLLMR